MAEDVEAGLTSKLPALICAPFINPPLLYGIRNRKNDTKLKSGS